MRARNSILVIWFTLLIGLFFQIIPWSPSYDMFKPHLFLLIIAYWLITLPYHISIGTAFVFGLIIDLCSGTILGVHAFIYSLIAYLLVFKYQLLSNLALWQQAFILFGISVCYNALIFIFQASIYHTITMSPYILLSSCVDGFLWIWIYLLLQRIKQSFAIN
ncbi:rod shape-determining protein MreD [Gilliamella apicola]|uniref:rod shape-determining protein MreD n=1 Tax=Gilliamella apicola TaxID=1196095 RepID=UPI000A35133F|nr:rod shape-determining protein MreD [Gilliamella apicola]OTQ30232.1 rod shape-determining protein MreD [Gilliamella apicola]